MARTWGAWSQAKGCAGLPLALPSAAGARLQGAATPPLLAHGQRLVHTRVRPCAAHAQGWFNETLPAAPIQRIAFLRLDGDL